MYCGRQALLTNTHTSGGRGRSLLKAIEAPQMQYRWGDKTGNDPEDGGVMMNGGVRSRSDAYSLHLQAPAGHPLRTLHYASMVMQVSLCLATRKLSFR